MNIKILLALVFYGACLYAAQEKPSPYADFWKSAATTAEQKRAQDTSTKPAPGIASESAQINPPTTACPVETVLPISYIANVYFAKPKYSFKKLKDKKQVQTIWLDKKLKASKPYRKLVYELLVEYAQARPSLNKIAPDIELAPKPGYNLVRPEVVLLINRKPYCSGGIRLKEKFRGFDLGDDFRGIEFEEGKADKELFGATRLILLHEITHLSEKHYYRCNGPLSKPLFAQKDERIADKAGAIVGKCEICTREVALRRLERFKIFKWDDYIWKSSAKKISTFESTIKEKFELWNSLSFEAIDKMELKTLNDLIEDMAKYSSLIKEDHPLEIERALRLIRYSKTDKYGIKGSKCKYHQKFGGGIKTEKMLKKYAEAIKKEEAAGEPIPRTAPLVAPPKATQAPTPGIPMQNPASTAAERAQFWIQQEAENNKPKPKAP